MIQFTEKELNMIINALYVLEDQHWTQNHQEIKDLIEKIQKQND